MMECHIRVLNTAFVFIFMCTCVSQMRIMGLEQNKAWHTLPPKAFPNAFHGLSVAKRAKKQGCCECYLI